jgi:hypothetical protein
MTIQKRVPENVGCGIEGFSTAAGAAEPEADHICTILIPQVMNFIVTVISVCPKAVEICMETVSFSKERC